ncbi:MULTISPECIES: NfeD family protein [unclassified Nocardioides]|uniref:NfeD family protein n=1 Tax=unclassified Nocardioides TaxID=2615069 RepID=UPI000710CAF7|nr:MULTISPECIES: hypothetical protein [unclassified Nocardioides]KQY63894.1 hypothetical protein ASD30_02620 [Nocardioides sp. Root140]KQZ69811.1 hypothetical protein ASD66_08860 [Nocardioides sp. Root151]KRF15907.1 hypothetical protein ASH02_04620 [Nocardioides sp. Soil796]
MIAFLLIGAVGIALLLFSLIVGDLLDGLLDFGGDLFSGAAMAGFLGAFGFGGAISYAQSDNMGLSIGVGLVAGLVVGAGAGWASYQLKQGGDEANVRTGDLTGQPATVISAIPENGYGEVSIVASGHITKLNARSEAPLAAGTPVTITAVLSATSVLVERRG